jgi:hypothetical protein
MIPTTKKNQASCIVKQVHFWFSYVLFGVKKIYNKYKEKSCKNDPRSVGFLFSEPAALSELFPHFLTLSFVNFPVLPQKLLTTSDPVFICHKAVVGFPLPCLVLYDAR